MATSFFNDYYFLNGNELFSLKNKNILEKNKVAKLALTLRLESKSEYPRAKINKSKINRCMETREHRQEETYEKYVPLYFNLYVNRIQTSPLHT